MVNRITSIRLKKKKISHLLNRRKTVEHYSYMIIDLFILFYFSLRLVSRFVFTILYSINEKNFNQNDQMSCELSDSMNEHISASLFIV